MHPRRTLLIDPLVAVLRGLVDLGVVRAVLEAPIAAVDAKGAAIQFPALAVNPKSETVTNAGTQSVARTLEVAVVVAARTIAEVDQVAGDAEDRVDQLGGWELRSTEFGVDADQARPFFYARLLYARLYATSKSDGGAQP